MKTFTFKLDSDKDAELLKKFLDEANFESKVEGFIETDEDDDLTDEELQMLDDRMAEYRNNPSIAIDAADVEAKLKQKYGF